MSNTKRTIKDRLLQWREQEASRRGVELYRVLNNRTIAELVETQPTDTSALQDIYGIGEKKRTRYGEKLLSLIHQPATTTDEETVHERSNDDAKTYSVIDFLQKVNQALRPLDVRVKGEVVSVNQNPAWQSVYFDIKDESGSAVLTCRISEHAYRLSNVALEEGMEVVVDGFSAVYPKSGRFSFQAQAIELSGEGQLLQEFLKLKKKLTEEGVFSEERKQPLPLLPSSIGVVTSRGGEVIHDIRQNLDQRHYQVKLYDARVEGKRSAASLLEGLEYFNNLSADEEAGEAVDVIIIGRGGGSLEALQGFNTEAVARAVADSTVPVIAAVGHERDVTLVDYAADERVSTPTAAAKRLNEQWNKAESGVDASQQYLLRTFTRWITQTQREITGASHAISRALDRFVGIVDSYEAQLQSSFRYLWRNYQTHKKDIETIAQESSRAFSNLLVSANQDLDDNRVRFFEQFSQQLTRAKREFSNLADRLEGYDPRRLLRQGYSIISDESGTLVRSVKALSVGESIQLQLSDGVSEAEVTDVQESNGEDT